MRVASCTHTVNRTAHAFCHSPPIYICSRKFSFNIDFSHPAHSAHDNDTDDDDVSSMSSSTMLACKRQSSARRPRCASVCVRRLTILLAQSFALPCVSSLINMEGRRSAGRQGGVHSGGTCVQVCNPKPIQTHTHARNDRARTPNTNYVRSPPSAAE